MKFEIKNRWNGELIFSVKTENWKLALEAAIKSGSNLSGSNLSGSNLRGSNLRGSNLSGSDLSGSDLRGSNLRGSNLRGSDLSGSDLRGSNLRGSNLRGSNLSGSDLSGSDLRGSNLRDSNLRDSNLRDSNLSGSDLSGSDLSGSDLRGSKGINKNLITPLRILLEQPGPIWAYKLVNAEGEGPFNGGINYLNNNVDEFVVKDFNDDENKPCGAGINLATLDWVIKEWKPGYRILIMEFFVNEPKGNLCVPTATDGKFRVKQCRRIGEKDLKELGLGDVGAKG